MPLAPERVDAFLDSLAADGIELHAFIVHQAGEQLFESYWWPHNRNTLHATHSSTKSFTGLAVCFAIDEGRLAIDDRILSFYPEFEPKGDSANLELMTIRDLLTMRSGHTVTPSGAEWRILDSSWVTAFLEFEVTRRPGEEFTYSSPSSHMLSAIVQRVVGEPISEYLRPRLFEPLSIEHFLWDVDPEGIASGGNGLSLTAQDFLKWGLVHLAGGRWQGRQVIPEWWVRDSTHSQVRPITTPSFDGRVYRPGIETDPTRVAYGYQVWLGPDGSYYTLGLFGQICLVVPDRHLVLVINAATRTRCLLQHVYGVLLAPEADAEAQDASFDLLQDRVRWHESAPQRKTSVTALAAAVYAAEANVEGITSIGVEVRDAEALLRLVDARGEHVVIAGLGSWRSGRSDMTTTLLHHSYQDEAALIEAVGYWADEQTLVFEIIFVETPFRETIALTFDGSRLRWKHSVNVNSGPTELPEFVAHLRR